MNELSSLPECRAFFIEPMLAALGARHCMIEGREVGDDGELAFVIPVNVVGTWPHAEAFGVKRGIAHLRHDDQAPTVEWFTSQREGCAALSRALKRLGWSRCIHARDVYGDAS